MKHAKKIPLCLSMDPFVYPFEFGRTITGAELADDDSNNGGENNNSAATTDVVEESADDSQNESLVDDSGVGSSRVWCLSTTMVPVVTLAAWTLVFG